MCKESIKLPHSQNLYTFPAAHCWHSLSDSTCCTAHLYYSSGSNTGSVEQWHSVPPGAAGCTAEAFPWLFDRMALHPSKPDRAHKKGGTERGIKGSLLCPYPTAPSFIRRANEVMSTCQEQHMGNNSIKRIFHPFHHILLGYRASLTQECITGDRSTQINSLSEFLLSLGWFQRYFEDSKWNTLQKSTGHEVLHKK